MDRPETIEETAELVTAAGGTGIAMRVDHARSDDVAALAARIDAEHGGLDVLVNDVWGGDGLIAWDTPFWEHDLQAGLGALRNAIDTHVITSWHAAPLLRRRPGALLGRGHRWQRRPLPRQPLLRPGQGRHDPAGPRGGGRAGDAPPSPSSR